MLPLLHLLIANRVSSRQKEVEFSLNSVFFTLLAKYWHFPYVLHLNRIPFACFTFFCCVALSIDLKINFLFSFCLVTVLVFFVQVKFPLFRFVRFFSFQAETRLIFTSFSDKSSSLKSMFHKQNGARMTRFRAGWSTFFLCWDIFKEMAKVERSRV